MELTDIKKLQRVKLPNKDFKAVYDLLKKDTENFSDDFLELYEDEIKELLKAVEKYSPEAIKKTPVKVPREKTPRPPKTPVIDFDSEDVVAEVQRDYNLTKEQAIKLIALRKEAYELKKENIEKLLDRLDKSEFYQGKNYASKSPIDKGRTRDLGKDSKQGSITEAEERKMSGTKFKRFSKKGAKNQYGTTEGGKVYYEYRLNRRDVDNKIRLENGGYLKMSPDKKKFFNKDFTPKFKAKINLFRSSIENSFAYQNSYDYENFTEFMQGIHTEIKDLISEGKNADGTPMSNWLTYDEGVKFVEKNMIDELKDIYYEKYNNEYGKGGGVDIPNAKKMFHLPMEIAIYVPSTADVSKPITASELRARVKEVESYLAETFGGFTASEKVGGYLSSKSSVIREKVVPVTAFATNEAFTSNKGRLVNKMSVWAKKWGQEAIGFEFEGDLYYVPQKFKTGGKLTATYIPRADIKMLTTVWGNNIRGKDLLDGAYTKRKNIKSEPKMARTMFEDEMFEYGDGGNINLRGGVPKKGSKLLFDLQYGDVFKVTAKNHTASGEYFIFIDLDEAYNVSLKVRPFDLKSENKPYKYINGIKDGEIVILSREEAGAMLLNYQVNNYKFKEGGSLASLSYSKFIKYRYDYYKKSGYETTESYDTAFRDLGLELEGKIEKTQFDNALKIGGLSMQKAWNQYKKESNITVKNGFYFNPYQLFKKGGKAKEPTIVRGYFDDEPYEYAKGGMLDVEDFEGLKKGDLISISYTSPMSGNNQAELIVKSKTTVGKGKVYEAEKITFTNTANPTGVNFYAYNRVRQMHQKIGFAIGDLAISNVKLI